ncbi:hypothetical protein Ctob_001862 [Chrysochromulina tobinii]|uniref:Uncharacterized protein n=1 Tax=Chrysochromulina tobinii TaxID=1460289 RepID=A0A0M0JR46_9EUKA|nr:hypothetical protein Ctob_001862 [Chrysochromulina tobinii]|eukprot:KOO29061.1 hypothetical protein Ctob_001862 [Chrysochromulina sp. CCMP291]
MALRLFVAVAALIASSSAFTAPVASVMKAPAKRTVVSSGKRSSSTEGKGGIFPWVTNQPGTYAKQLFLSGVDFLGADGDKWIGWGAMPDSVKKLYNRKGRKGLLPQ